MSLPLEPEHILNCNGSNFTPQILEKILEMLHEHGEIVIVNLAPKSVSLEAIKICVAKMEEP